MDGHFGVPITLRNNEFNCPIPTNLTILSPLLEDSWCKITIHLEFYHE